MSSARSVAFVLAGFVANLSIASAAPPPLTIIAWNVESEGSDADTIADELSRYRECHVFALSEVLRQDLRRFADAIGHANEKQYLHVHSTTGHDDRLQIIFDATRLKLLESRELFNVAGADLQDANWRHRSPLVAKFRDQETGQHFFLVVNHLARGSDTLRTQQAAALREWARVQREPLVAIGDFNFDYDFVTERGNDGFHAFIQDDIWRWVKPDALIDSNWADHDEDGDDDYPGSLLDFAFVSGDAQRWQNRSRVIVRRGDFPDNARTSDHRPIELTIQQ